MGIIVKTNREKIVAVLMAIGTARSLTAVQEYAILYGITR
jgi:hypothetical protein